MTIMKSRRIHDICLWGAFAAAIAAEHISGAKYAGALVAIILALISFVALMMSRSAKSPPPDAVR